MSTNPNLDMKYDDPSEDPRYSVPAPKVVGHFPPSPAEQEVRIQNLKYIYFAYNLILFLFGGTVLGIGIWMAVDRAFLTFIIGTDLYAVAIYMVLIGGGLVFLFTILGCFGAVTENRCMLWTFIFVLAFLFLVLFIGSIIGIAFQVQIGASVQDTMAQTLKENYAVDMHKWFNRRVTEAWDKAQERLRCCGVKNQGWDVFRDTRWFKKFGAINEGIDETKRGSEDQKPYVPKSCCVKDRFWRYVNLDVCQKWRLGPPGSPVDGAINRAVYYDGCYNQGVKYMEENTGVMIGLGLSTAFLLVVGIFLTFLLLKWTKGYK